MEVSTEILWNLFLLNSNSNFREYIAFEADEQIFAELNKKVVKENLTDSVATCNYAVWDKEEILKFQVGEQQETFPQKGI